MSSLETYKIDLQGLTEDITVREFDLGNDFFASLEGAQLQEGSLHVSASIRKMSGFFQLQLHTEGTVVVSCDRCLDDMDQPVEADSSYTIRLGGDYQENDDTITVDEQKPVIDLSWLIYEAAMLAIPIKHVHAPGKCNSAMTQKLNELSGAVRSSKEETTATDSRWDKLRSLKIENTEQ